MEAPETVLASRSTPLARDKNVGRNSNTEKNVTVGAGRCKHADWAEGVLLAGGCGDQCCPHWTSKGWGPMGGRARLAGVFWVRGRFRAQGPRSWSTMRP